jgi:PAS domain S-box-containing protein
MLEEQKKSSPPDKPGLEEARATLRATEAHFRLLIESVRDYAIFLLDVTGRVATWNIGAERIKGYRASEIIGRHFSTFYPEEDVRGGKCELELEVATRDGRFEDEGWRIRKDGTQFWANVVITAVRDETGELVGFAKVTRDLTERRAAEDERIRLGAEQKAREASDAANRAKDDFLAHVSHELRTPLNAILGWSRLLGAGLDPERSTRAIATIERNAGAMTQLIDDLLDISRIISGKMRLEVDNVDLALVIERALDTVKLSAEAKGIKVHTVLDTEHALVLGDIGRLQQVVWNLLSNAVKFTPTNGDIHVFLRRQPASIEVIVRDTGVGIASDKLQRVFETFWQDNHAPVTASRGLGLGLSICRNLVELHGGRIDVESQGQGRGSTFTVTFPLVAVRTAQPAMMSPPLGDTSRLKLPSIEGLKILVVEDDVDARDLLRTVLESRGCIVVTASDVPTALAAIARQVPDLLLSDIGLPGESGLELIRQIRALPVERGGHLPAVAITAYARVEDRLKALGAGFLVHVAKPVDPNELVMVVAALSAHLHH